MNPHDLSYLIWPIMLPILAASVAMTRNNAILRAAQASPETEGRPRRFYSNYSFFVHGGVDKPGEESQPVVGQQKIHERIMALNFDDCHAKIRQVDSQITINNAVVVQVTGELSNGGGPMRRFMQTFVLAPQTAKKYYVHNDIFRYQDEVFPDESEDEGEHRRMDTNIMYAPNWDSTLESDVVQPKPVHTEPVHTDPAHTEPVRAEPIRSEPIHRGAPQAVLSQPPKTPTPPPVRNTQTPDQEPAERVSQPIKSDPEPQQEHPASFSWASVVNNKAATPCAVVPPMNANMSSTQEIPTPLSEIASEQEQETAVERSLQEVRPSEPTQPPQPNSRSSAEHGPRRSDQGGFDRQFDRWDATNEKYPDSHQVFVGNLPTEVYDLELKKFFGGYGNVVAVRINRRSQSKIPFGFVVFDGVEPVKKLLNEKRVEMNGHRLNVEEKKARVFDKNAPRGAPRGGRGFSGGSGRPRDKEGGGSRSDRGRGSFPPRR